MPSRPPTHSQLMRAKHPERYRPTYDQRRGTAAERGYDGTWKRLRIMHLRANPLCVHCLKENRLTSAVEVDHIKAFHGIGDPLRLDPDNLQGLCKPCHSRKTATEDGAFGHKRKDAANV